MEVVGKGTVRLFTPRDEGIHAPGPQELWQESMAQVWWDPKQDIGGFYRLGHETNHATGPEVVLWSTTYSPEGIFKHDSRLPLRPKDRSDDNPMHFGAGDDVNSYDFDGNQVWTLRGDGMALDLRVHDYHESIDCYPKDPAIADFSPVHIEVAGSVSGKLSMKGRDYDIDGFSIRDKGWGERQWSTMMSHLWTVGAFGPDLSFCALCWHSRSNQFANFGWIVRGRQIIYARKLDFVTFLEADAVSTRGGQLVMELTTGETIRFDFEAVAPAAISFIHGITCVDSPSRIRCGDRVGYGCWETTTNAMGGWNPPLMAINGILDNGWHPREPRSIPAILPV